MNNIINEEELYTLACKIKDNLLNDYDNIIISNIMKEIDSRLDDINSLSCLGHIDINMDKIYKRVYKYFENNFQKLMSYKGSELQ